MKQHAILVAGGKGNRMQSDTPKQFLNLNGLPVLMQTIKVFWQFNNAINIVLVLPEQHQETWVDLVKEYRFDIPHTVVTGGKERFHSVLNGLKTIDDGVVGIHDGVRPLVSIKTLQRCYETAEKTKVAIPVMPVVESLRKNDTAKGNIAVNRADYWSVQTPQCFDVKALQACFNVGFTEAFTDDASVWEYAGNSVTLVEGNVENIKITTPFDLEVAGLLLQANGSKRGH